ncbi:MULTISPECIES: threonine-phosphate decarboxylase CobD [Thalassospira]|uniref:threonine-phosphate decarboxylase n=1 Tax=Thalassospira aquimaris TaxID=3037796 RepID=A0ABT6GE03_9PROT|nr:MULTISPECIES: threonine-phosphate decarboxylase CobD [Thalassospira]MDG4720246.1 threonine-phosphate decarboxylase CobD [Thalassospira sp. FZY0004]
MASRINQPSPASPINHGGAIDAAARKYGIPAHRWLDLSTGINPVAYPVAEIATAHWQRLPLSSELDGLKHAACKYYGVPDTQYLVAAPGTQALIQTIPYWLPDHAELSGIHIMGPTYGEHARCWQRAGHDCELHETAADNRKARARDILATATPGTVVVIVNPNNPDGGILPPDDIAELAALAEQADSWLIVDEAFMDCQPGFSVCPMIYRLPRTLILRSFGKFFGLAGVRLGCLVTAPNLATDLSDRIGPWAIPGPTIEIATRAFSDTSWQTETRQRLAADGNRLDDLIAAKTSLTRSGTTDLFRYYDGTDCAQLADHLARHGILVRLFDHDITKVRFGFPGTTTDWQRIETALDQW